MSEYDEYRSHVRYLKQQGKYLRLAIVAVGFRLSLQALAGSFKEFGDALRLWKMFGPYEGEDDEEDEEEEDE